MLEEADGLKDELLVEFLPAESPKEGRQPISNATYTPAKIATIAITAITTNLSR